MLAMDSSGRRSPPAVIYRDRRAAGVALASELHKRGTKATVVLGLTRGGVPVAFEVAQSLGARLDVIVVKKIGVPFNSELAVGAVCSDGTAILRQSAIDDMGIPDEFVARELARRSAEAKESEKKFRAGHRAASLQGERVVLVDDGLATGATMKAAAVSAKARGAAHVTVAVPVASEYAMHELLTFADDLIALNVPAKFYSVGQYYEDFSQTTDETVVTLLGSTLSVTAPGGAAP